VVLRRSTRIVIAERGWARVGVGCHYEYRVGMVTSDPTTDMIHHGVTEFDPVALLKCQ
jgi:hypothetical protein